MAPIDPGRPTADDRHRGPTALTPTTPLATTGSPRRGSDYAQLSRQVHAAGLLARRPGYYRVRIGFTTGLWAAGWAVFVLLGRSWWQLAVAVVQAVAFAQLGFLGHDAGHRQIFHSRRANDLAGRLCANVLIGLSYRWWIDKHNRHHAHPNEVGSDPDITGAGIAFTPDQARARRTRAGRWVARHQGGLFFPMLLLEGLNLHIASLHALASGRSQRTRGWWVETVLLAGHIGGYLAVVVLVLQPWQSPGLALAFVAAHQGLLGVYLGCSFAPSHKGMPLLHPGQEPDFLRRQVLTSRNIRAGRVLELAMGGLNYQIEHHLFPSMPSPTLRRAAPLIRAFCSSHQLAYHQASLFDSYTQVLGYLHRVGTITWPRPSEQPSETPTPPGVS